LSTKLVANSLTHLQYTPGVPIEVSPFAHTTVLRSLHTKLDSPNATLRMARAKAGPVVTDNGNFIIDAPFSEAILRKPREVRSWVLTLKFLY
jgi:ribose 5-phosphate isomerase A